MRRQAVFLCHHVTIELLCQFPHAGNISVSLSFPDAHSPCDRQWTLVTFVELFEDLSVFGLNPPKLLHQHRQDIRCFINLIRLLACRLEFALSIQCIQRGRMIVIKIKPPYLLALCAAITFRAHDGQYRGGYLPYGYKLVHKGRTNKKNQPVRDLVIDEDEAVIVREIFHLLIEEGYGTNRVANYLNERGIKTKRGTTLWRATSVRALIDNRIYLGYMRMGDTYSPKQEHLQIIDEATWEKCQETVKGRATCLKHEMKVPERTDTRSLLSGLIFCADCGSRLTFSHNTTRRKLADGTEKLYERDCYRCYRKINARESCSGQSSYCADTINETVLYEIRRILSIIKQKPEAALLEKAKENHGDVYEVAYKQAEKDFFEAHKQMNALEDQAMKFLTGENTVDISIVNAMMPKYKEKLETAQRRMEEAKAKMEKEKEAAQTATQEVTDLLSWADTFDEANAETKHMIIARLVERIEINHDYEVEIKFRISVEQYMRIAA